MCAEFKKNIKTIPDICVWDQALDLTSFVWLWKTPIGQIGLNVALLFLWQPPKPHLFYNLSSLHTALYFCALAVMMDVQKFLSPSPSNLTQVRCSLLPLYKREQTSQKSKYQTWDTLRVPISVSTRRVRAFMLVLPEFPPWQFIWDTLRTNVTPHILGFF